MTSALRELACLGEAGELLVVIWKGPWETPQASRSISETVCARAAEGAVGSHWLTCALAVFSGEPEPTVSHLRFLWPPAAHWGSCSHRVHCFKSVGTGDVKILRQALLSPNSHESRTKGWRQMGSGRGGSSLLLYLHPRLLALASTLLPGCVVMALLGRPGSSPSASMRSFHHLLCCPGTWSEGLLEAPSLGPQPQRYENP